MGLPLVKHGRSRNARAPGKKDITKLIGLVTTPEAADYLLKTFKETMEALSSEMVEKSKAVLGKLQQLRDYIYEKSEVSTDPWSGKVSHRTDFQNLQHSLAQKAQEEMSTKLRGNVKMNFAVSDSAQLVRGFVVDGKQADKTIASLFDKLLNAWFAEQNSLISKDSIIYEGTENGEIRLDQQGNPIKADSEKVKRLINSTTGNSFQQFLQTRSIQVSIHEHKYPEQKVEVKTQPVVQKAAEKATPVPEAPTYEGGRGPSTGV